MKLKNKHNESMVKAAKIIPLVGPFTGKHARYVRTRAAPSQAPTRAPTLWENDEGHQYADWDRPWKPGQFLSQETAKEKLPGL